MFGKVVSRRSRRTHFSLSATVLIVFGAMVVPLPTALTCPLTPMVMGPATQGFERELNASGPASLTIKNRNGRVSVIASAESNQKMSLQATSPGAPVESGDVHVNGNLIDVRGRRDNDRIDITLHVPPRSRVKIESDTGMVEVMGDLAFAEVITNTGTIHADVSLNSLRFSFLWEASRPRYLSDVELPKVKEGKAGKFMISGTLGERVKRSKHKKTFAADNEIAEIKTTTTDEREKSADDKDGAVASTETQTAKLEPVRLDLRTQRGVILLNVDPSMVPPDLRERPLTEAARAIVRSGDSRLMDAIRKVSPRMFGDYARTLPPPRTEPALLAVRAQGELVTAVTPQLMRVNASVTDRNGRAIPGMRDAGFLVIEVVCERNVVLLNE